MMLGNSFLAQTGVGNFAGVDIDMDKDKVKTPTRPRK